MIDNMDKVDKLIDLIDNELLKLHEASIHKGDYYHFNFKQALINLNREFLKNGLYDKSNYVNSNHGYEQIVRNYRDVFNDLSNFRAESIHFRYMSFDPNTGELEIEHITRNKLNHTTKREIYKKSYFTIREPEEVDDDNEEDFQAALDGVDKYLRADIIAANEAAEKAIVEAESLDKAEADQAFKYYSNLKYPEENYRELPWVCKFEYLIRDCIVKYDRLGKVNYKNENDYFQFYFDNIDIFNKCITKDVSFDLIFGRGFQLGYSPHFDVYINKVSFEEYAKSLQDDRLLETDLNNDIDILNESNSIPVIEVKNDSKSIKDEIVVIDIIVNLLIPKHINREQSVDFKQLLINGRLKDKVIYIYGKYQHFHNLLFPYYSIIPTKYQKSWYDFILNNFKFNDKDISKQTISSGIRNQKIV